MPHFPFPQCGRFAWRNWSPESFPLYNSIADATKTASPSTATGSLVYLQMKAN